MQKLELTSKTSTLMTGEVAQRLRALVVLLDDPAFQTSCGSSQSSAISVPECLNHCSGLRRYQQGLCCTDIHSDKTLIHRKINNLFKNLHWSANTLKRSTTDTRLLSIAQKFIFLQFWSTYFLEVLGILNRNIFSWVLVATSSR